MIGTKEILFVRRRSQPFGWKGRWKGHVISDTRPAAIKTNPLASLTIVIACTVIGKRWRCVNDTWHVDELVNTIKIRSRHILEGKLSFSRLIARPGCRAKGQEICNIFQWRESKGRVAPGEWKREIFSRGRLVYSFFFFLRHFTSKKFSTSREIIPCFVEFVNREKISKVYDIRSYNFRRKLIEVNISYIWECYIWKKIYT